jgi:hypothetical protein
MILEASLMGMGEVEEIGDENVDKQFGAGAWELLVGMETIEGLVKTGWVLEAAKDLTMDTGADFAAKGLEHVE